MLIDLGVACTWLALSAAGALGLSSLLGDSAGGEPATDGCDDRGAFERERRRPAAARDPLLGAPA